MKKFNQLFLEAEVISKKFDDELNNANTKYITLKKHLSFSVIIGCLATMFLFGYMGYKNKENKIPPVTDKSAKGLIKRQPLDWLSFLGGELILSSIVRKIIKSFIH